MATRGTARDSVEYLLRPHLVRVLVRVPLRIVLRIVKLRVKCQYVGLGVWFERNFFTEMMKPRLCFGRYKMAPMFPFDVNQVKYGS
jgi:hypothetical protein